MPYSITGRHFLIISAETQEAAATECSGRSGHVTSDSRKSANPIDLRNQHIPFLIVDSKITALNSILEIINPEYSAGNPIMKMSQAHKSTPAAPVTVLIQQFQSPESPH
jgi:hypothetical protein